MLRGATENAFRGKGPPFSVSTPRTRPNTGLSSMFARVVDPAATLKYAETGPSYHSLRIVTFRFPANTETVTGDPITK